MNGSCVYNNNMYAPAFTGNHTKYLRRFMDSSLKKTLKQECIDSVSGMNQFERAIVVNIKNNEVVSATNGTLTDVPVIIPRDVLFGRNYAILHSHPTLIGKNGEKYSLPLSFGDFEILVNNRSVKEITAINQKGGETILQKTDEYTKLSKEQIAEVREKYFKTLYDKLCNEEEKKKIDSLNEYVRLHLNSYAVEQSIADKLLAKQFDPEAENVIKDFFKNISESLKLKFMEK